MVKLLDVIRIETTNKLLFDSTQPSKNGKILKVVELNEDYRIDFISHNYNMAQVVAWNKKEETFYYYNIQSPDRVVK